VFVKEDSEELFCEAYVENKLVAIGAYDKNNCICDTDSPHLQNHNYDKCGLPDRFLVPNSGHFDYNDNFVVLKNRKWVCPEETTYNYDECSCESDAPGENGNGNGKKIEFVTLKLQHEMEESKYLKNLKDGNSGKRLEELLSNLKSLEEENSKLIEEMRSD
jgi:hypothetical protein